MTPPVGIYARSWGAATHECAEGVHRPFTATAAVFAPLDGDRPTLALVALDIGWFQHVDDERALRGSVLERTGLHESELLIQMSHTHAGANTNSQLTGKPGTELIGPYLEQLAHEVGDAVLEARSRLAPAFVALRHRPLLPGREPRPLGRRRRALRLRLQPRHRCRRHGAGRARD